LFNRTAIEVCEGQQWDMNFETPPEVSLHEYLAMIRLKTAVLLAASLKTGAIVAGAPPAEAEILYQAGINAGLAFQLEDDLLDVYGHQEKFGKVSGGDIAACKKTYLYLKSLEVAGSRKAELIEIYNSRNSDVKTKIEKVKAAYDAYGIRMITRQEIQRYCAKAIGLISSLNLPEENKALPGDFIVSLVGREH
jgi:geranylgeranyl diphosphate synthase type II